MQGFSHVIVGTDNLEAALELWSESLGLSVEAQAEGPDRGTAALLGIEPEDIRRQAVVGMTGSDLGRIHLVEFSQPGEPVRAGASTTDLCPKNLDLRCVDMPARVEELKAAGHRLRSDWHRLPLDWAEIREVQLLAPDEVNVSLIEIVGEELAFNPAGFFGVTLAVATSADNRPERDFFQEVLGLEVLSHNLLEGEAVEQMVGAPPGTQLDIYILGRPEEQLGRVELVTYREAPGEDRYRRAEAPAPGALRVCFSGVDLHDVVKGHGQGTVQHGTITTPAESGDAVTLRTPAGWGVVLFGSH